MKRAPHVSTVISRFIHLNVSMEKDVRHVFVRAQPSYMRAQVLDYVDMIKSVYGKRYMLVVNDSFSRWVEAVPSKD